MLSTRRGSSQSSHRARPRSLAEEGAPHGAPRRVPALATSPATLLQATSIHISSSSSSSSSGGGGGGGGSGTKGGPLLNGSNTTVSNGSAPNARSYGRSTETTFTFDATAHDGGGRRTRERYSSSPAGGEVVRPVRPWACMREPGGRGPSYPHNFDANFLNSLPPINRFIDRGARVEGTSLGSMLTEGVAGVVASSVSGGTRVSKAGL